MSRGTRSDPHELDPDRNDEDQFIRDAVQDRTLTVDYSNTARRREGTLFRKKDEGWVPQERRFTRTIRGGFKWVGSDEKQDDDEDINLPQKQRKTSIQTYLNVDKIVSLMPKTGAPEHLFPRYTEGMLLKVLNWSTPRNLDSSTMQKFEEVNLTSAKVDGQKMLLRATKFSHESENVPRKQHRIKTKYFAAGAIEKDIQESHMEEEEQEEEDVEHRTRASVRPSQKHSPRDSKLTRPSQVYKTSAVLKDGKKTVRTNNEEDAERRKKRSVSKLGFETPDKEPLKGSVQLPVPESTQKDRLTPTTRKEAADAQKIKPDVGTPDRKPLKGSGQLPVSESTEKDRLTTTKQKEAIDAQKSKSGVGSPGREPLKGSGQLTVPIAGGKFTSEGSSTTAPEFKTEEMPVDESRDKNKTSLAPIITRTELALTLSPMDSSPNGLPKGWMMVPVPIYKNQRGLPSRGFRSCLCSTVPLPN